MRAPLLCVGVLALAIALTAADARTAPSSRQRPTATSLEELLELYDGKQYDAAITRISQASLTEANGDFDADARRWVTAGDPSNLPRRRMVAATLALEIAHRLPAPPHRRESFVLWACALIREGREPLPSDAERFWYLSSVAALEDIGAWQTLVGVAQVPAWLRANQRSNADGALALAEEQRGHLSHAHERFPDEPRFGFVLVEWLDRLTWRINTIAQDGPLFPMVPGTPAADEVTAALISTLENGARARVTENARLPKDIWARNAQQNAALALALVRALDNVAAGYAALVDRDSLRAEAELRLGYVHLRLGRWPLALEHLRQASRVATDRDLLYLSHYFIGWAQQRGGRHADAIAAYREALSVIPNVRSATTLLAAQLFLGDSAAEREEAYRLLDTLYKTPHAPDPFVAFRSNDGRLWQVFMARLRETL